MGMAELIIITMLFYLACGGLFSIVLLLKGIDRIDPAARNAGFGFKLIILPGLIVLWPLLLKKFLATLKRSR